MGLPKLKEIKALKVVNVNQFGNQTKIQKTNFSIDQLQLIYLGIEQRDLGILSD